MPIDGFTLVVSQYLANCTKAVCFGGVYHVSPAMYELISKAETQEELEHVLENIGVVNMDPKVDWERRIWELRADIKRLDDVMIDSLFNSR